MHGLQVDFYEINTIEKRTKSASGIGLKDLKDFLLLI